MSWRQDGAVTPSGRERSRAGALRRRSTGPERKLWWHLQYRMPMIGSHWRRQVPLAGYVVDFCCLEHKLVVEVDGNQHGFDANRAVDAIRTRRLETQGFRVLRFSNQEVVATVDIVLDTILAAMEACP